MRDYIVNKIRNELPISEFVGTELDYGGWRASLKVNSRVLVSVEHGEGFYEGEMVVMFDVYRKDGSSTVHQYEVIPLHAYEGIPDWFRSNLS
jgi:hypothetical protein